jgi:hypothetical protein
MNNFENILKGGDLRSKGESEKIVLLTDNQELFDELFQLLFNADRKVVMRAADAVEKITLKHPEFLTSHKKKILGLCYNAQNIELKWHLALLVSRLKLSKQEFERIWQTLKNWATDKKESKIVRVNSLQGLFDLLIKDNEMEQDFRFIISAIEKENIPSLNARIKQLKKKEIQFYKQVL